MWHINTNWHPYCLKGVNETKIISVIEYHILRQTVTTQTQTNIETSVDALYETSQFAMGVGMVSVALIAFWAMICMASAIFSNGIAGVIKSFFSAVTGS